MLAENANKPYGEFQMMKRKKPFQVFLTRKYYGQTGWPLSMVNRTPSPVFPLLPGVIIQKNYG